MPDAFDDLAVALDPEFGERQWRTLLVRLEAAGRQRPPDTVATVDDVVVIELAASPAGTATRRHRWVAVAVAAAVVAAAVVVVMVRAGHDSGPVAPSPTTIRGSVLGPPRLATGSPVTIGFLTDGGASAAGTEGADVVGARAAAAYVNEHLGGVDGHPIVLAVCAADDPVATVPCVSELVARNVPAIVLADVRAVAVAESIIGPARIPFVSYVAPLDGGGRTSGSFVLSNSLASFAGPVELAVETGATRVLVVVAGAYDNGQYQSDVQSLLRPLYARAGVAVTFELLGIDLAGVTSAVTTALATTPDLVHIVGPGICARTLIALRAAAFAGTIAGNPDCVGPVVAAQVPGGSGGVRVFSSESSDPGDPAVARYRAVMTAYAPAADPEQALAADGYAAVIGFTRALAGLRGDITPESVRTAMRSMPSLSMPLSAAQTFRCDGTQVADDPVACSRATVMATLDAVGVPRDPRALDIGPLVGP